MRVPKIPLQALSLVLSLLLASSGCGSPRGKPSTGQQTNLPGSENEEQQILVVEGNEVYSSYQQPAAGGSTSTKKALANLSRSHPRLMLLDRKMVDLKKRRSSDKILSGLINNTFRRANKYLNAPSMKYTANGPAMLRVAHEAMKRSYTLGLAYRATKEKKYVKKLEENLLQVCSFKDWTPFHFLATAEMVHAVSIGYDWGFSGLSESAKVEIRKGLMRNGLNPGIKDIKSGKAAKWIKTDYNHNIVCSFGLVIGALAIAEYEPEIAERIIDAARVHIKRPLSLYGPEGSWPEGPGYWTYATEYMAYGFTVLQLALGTDFELSDHKGMSQTGFFGAALTGPSGRVAVFSDTRENSRRNPTPSMFYLASRYNEPALAAEELAFLSNNKGEVQHLVWYPPASMIGGERLEIPLDAFFNGTVETLYMRGGHDPDDVFVPFKAGFNQVNHAHLDLGNFEFDALDVRWARDLGSDNYSLPGYWESGAKGRRWSYFRMGSFSHNILTFGGTQQKQTAKSKFARHSIGTNEPFGIVEVTGAYPQITGSLLRGVKLLGGRTAMLVQDEFDLLKSTEIAWGMTTDAKVLLQGSTARLSQDGQEMVATIIEPSGAKFTVEAAPNHPKAQSNKGVSRLMIRVNGREGAHRFVVQLSPVWPKGGALSPVSSKPLSRW